MFQKGDLIVYGNMGVCRVEAVEAPAGLPAGTAGIAFPRPAVPPREHVAVRAHGRAFPCPSGPAHCQTGKETYLVFDP